MVSTDIEAVFVFVAVIDDLGDKIVFVCRTIWQCRGGVCVVSCSDCSGRVGSIGSIGSIWNSGDKGHGHS